MKRKVLRFGKGFRVALGNRRTERRLPFGRSQSEHCDRIARQQSLDGGTERLDRKTFESRLAGSKRQQAGVGGVGDEVADSGVCRLQRRR